MSDDKIFEAAKAAMVALIPHDNCNGILPDDTAIRAVGYATALMSALRETAGTNAALDTLTAEAQEAGDYDEVGDWRSYVLPGGKRAIYHVADGNFRYAVDAFSWANAPQGEDFWARVRNGRATPAEEARARDFARRVLEAMESESD